MPFIARLGSQTIAAGDHAQCSEVVQLFHAQVVGCTGLLSRQAESECGLCLGV